MQRGRLGIGPGSHLGVERLDERLVLPRDGGALTACGVEPHQSAVDALADRVDDQRAPSGLDRVVRASRGGGRREPAIEDVQDESTEALALGAQPFLEVWLGQPEPREELAVIERHHGPELARGTGGAAHECCEVRLDRGGIEDEIGTVEHERVGVLTELAANHEDLVPHAGASPRVVGVTPEQRGDGFAGPAVPGTGGQVAEHRATLPAGEADEHAVRPPDLETTEQLDPKPTTRHHNGP